MLLQNERVAVVNDKEKREHRFLQMDVTEPKNLNLRYKPRNGINSAENIRLRLRGMTRKESAMGVLFSDCIALGVK